MTDTTQLERLFDEYGNRIYAFCLKLCGNVADAEDLAAEVFLAAPKSLSSFRGEATETTLLYKIALNKHRNMQRAHARLLRRIEAWSKPDEAREHPMLIEIAMAQALNKLSAKQREAFLLVKAEGLRYAEAAAVLDVPVGTVQSRVHQAAKQMATLLELQDHRPYVEAKNEL